MQGLMSYLPKTTHCIDEGVWMDGGVLSLDHVYVMARLCAHQLRACAAHSGAEWQRLGVSGGRDRHRFTSTHSIEV